MILLPDNEKKIVYEACVKPKDKEILSELRTKNEIPIWEYPFYSSYFRKRSYEERYIPFEERIELFSGFPSEVFDYGKSISGLVSTHHTQYEITYINPLHLACSEFQKMENLDICYPLLSLFNKFHNFDRGREIEILEQASDMIKRLQDSSLDDNTIKEIIQKLWPKFGYFATHIYDNLDFVVNEKCKYYELQSLIDAERHLRYIEENGLILDEAQRNEFLNMVGIKNEAEDNVKVLSLVKKVNDRIGSNR